MSIDATRARLFCTHCGASVDADARFCHACGTRQEPDDGAAAATAALDAGPAVTLKTVVQAPSPAPAPAPAPAAPDLWADWQRSLPGPFNSVPPELVVVCALMAAAGGLLLVQAVLVLPDLFELLGMGSLGVQFGLLLLAVWAMLALFGGGAIYLAWRLGHGDRVARGLAYVVLGGLAGSLLVGDDHGTALVLVMLACTAALAAARRASVRSSPGARLPVASSRCPWSSPAPCSRCGSSA